MKFKDYVANLVKFLEEKPEAGEYDTYYAVDEEGNGYEEVTYEEPTEIDYRERDWVIFSDEEYDDDEDFGFNPNGILIN